MTVLDADRHHGSLVEELIATVEFYNPGVDKELIRHAFDYAQAHHEGQLRQSGEEFIRHPWGVAQICARLHLDEQTIAAALLHDVVEDTATPLDEVRKVFGDEVARCVDGVTKLGKLKMASREERQAESVRKMLLAMVTDIRIILVKLADRLHNLRTMSALAREKQERIAEETLEIYVPIAHRLGMGKMRGQLEDLSFQLLDPEAYLQVVDQIENNRRASEGFLSGIRATVEEKLREDKVPARVEGRLKRAYSVWQKLKRQKVKIEEVYDLLAIRIITDSVKNCYAALGVIHNEWHPIPGRIKDFIAIPRPNLYQSLHTSVMGPNGQAFEVQIRTEEMHRLAEEGIAAHWKYKEGKRGSTQDDQRIGWLRQLVEWQREMRDPGDFMNTLKVDLSQTEEVYCFTPQGRVLVLPRDASPIDFAYAVHSEVGNRCVGAKVNGRIVPLKYGLRNGDVVEILTQNGHLPSRDWLSIVRTSKARNKINHYIRTVERARAIELGQKHLEREARRAGVQMARIGSEALEKVAAEYGYSKIEDLHAALGYGKFSPRQVINKAVPDLVPAAEPPKPATAQPGAVPPDDDLIITVNGMDDLLTSLAKCCNPIRGEAIVGYVTRGRGISVHSARCSHVVNLMFEAERRVPVEWTKGSTKPFLVRVRIITDDRPGMLAQFTTILGAENCNIRTLEARSADDHGDDSATVEMTIEVKDKKQLEKLQSSLRRVSGVRDIERVQ